MFSCKLDLEKRKIGAKAQDMEALTVQYLNDNYQKRACGTTFPQLSDGEDS